MRPWRKVAQFRDVLRFMVLVLSLLPFFSACWSRVARLAGNTEMAACIWFSAFRYRMLERVGKCGVVRWWWHVTREKKMEKATSECRLLSLELLGRGSNFMKFWWIWSGKNVTFGTREYVRFYEFLGRLGRVVWWGRVICDDCKLR